MNAKPLLIMSFILLGYNLSLAQSGSLDASFDPGSGAEAWYNPYIGTTSIQSDGKIIIGGWFTSYNGTARRGIARLNSDGSLDTSFDPETGANSSVNTISIQSDGKIIIGGGFTSYNGTVRNHIARLNTDGSLDTSFDPGTGANSSVSTISIQSDGKIIIGGGFTSYNGTARNYIARLNTDGSLDTSFDTGFGASGSILSISIQSDGKIIIGGNIISFNGIAINHIARLNTDGSLDPSFDTGKGAHVNGSVLTTNIQGDGKVIVSGQFDSINGIAINHIARLNTDGSLDTSFNPITGANGQVYTTSIQNDGKFVIGGSFTFYDGTARNHIARLNSDGSLDTSFYPGTGTDDKVLTTSIQSDGRIIIGGKFTFYNRSVRTYIARIDTIGATRIPETLDLSFDPGTGANNSIITTSIQSDGRIVFGGLFTEYNGTAINHIARLTSDGSLDTSFVSGMRANGGVLTISIQSDGKIIIGGEFTEYNGTARNHIARLNADGSLDTSFDPGTGAGYLGYPLIRTTSIQSDGKIIIGGDFTTFNGTAIRSIARLNSDGSLDTSFDPGTGAGTVKTISIQSDGKIIIGGRFTFFNGLSRGRIARLNVDGSLDTTFDQGRGANRSIHTSSIQSDGKIIIVGDFTEYNGTARNHIARLNADGSIDTTFNPGKGANNYVHTISIQSDGKIIIGGYFTIFNETAINRIIRLNTDGSLDTAFDPGFGANHHVYTTSIQSDGKIIIGGGFTSYNRTAINRIARLEPTSMGTPLNSK